MNDERTTNGLLVLVKRAGDTSRMALEPIRCALGKKTPVGHAGTLDPFATGVLLALVGDATRLNPLAMALPKTYLAVVRFGAETDTLDPEGEVVARADPGESPPTGLEAAVAGFQGEIEQVPPAYSALKIEGRRAHRIARAGGTPKLAPRRVVVHEISIDEVRWPDVEIRIRCGSGTYVRSIARDLGRALSLPASLAQLTRSAIGPFRTEDGLEVRATDVLDPAQVRAALLPPVAIVRAAALPEVVIDRDRARSFVHGQPVPVPEALTWDSVAVILEDDDRLLGLGAPAEGPAVRPVRVLADAQRALHG